MILQFHSWAHVQRNHKLKRHTHTHTHTPVFIATKLTIVKTEKPKYPWVDEWAKKMWYIFTTEYYLAIKNNEIIPFAATCLDLRVSY